MSIDPFAAERDIPVVGFEKGQRKDEFSLQHDVGLPRFEGIYMIGVAQEKISTFRTRKRRNAESAARYRWIVLEGTPVSQYYL